MSDLEERIRNRSTELHRVYDQAMLDKSMIEQQLAHLPKVKEKLEDDLLSVNALIAKCRRRAAEQGFPDAL